MYKSEVAKISKSWQQRLRYILCSTNGGPADEPVTAIGMALCITGRTGFLHLIQLKRQLFSRCFSKKVPQHRPDREVVYDELGLRKGGTFGRADVTGRK